MITSLIVGLGNPGKQYANTPHNVGFMAIDALRASLEAPAFTHEPKFQTDVSQVNEALLMKPTTFMNLSGKAVAKAANYYKISPNNVFIIHDDFSVALGSLKISVGKGAANHNGVLSILESLGENISPRFRIGIGKPTNLPLESYVLATIAPEDMPSIKHAIHQTVAAVHLALSKGIEQAMNSNN